MPLRAADRRWGFVAALFVCAAAAAPEVSAQTVVFRSRGRGMPEADQALSRVLERGNYRVFTRDTVLAEGKVISGDLIVLRSALRVEGHIEGDLIGVQSDIFARPGGRIDGVVAVLAGGFYGSSLAELAARPINGAIYEYAAVERSDGTWVVTAPGAKARVRLAGLYGLLAPQYDRVNALTVELGVDYERGASRWAPDASARVRWRSVRSDVDGDLELRWPFGRHQFALRGGLMVRSNDRWINADLENSLYAFVAGADTRNYYETGFAEADLLLEYGTKVTWWVRPTVAWERARSLSNRHPFSIVEARGGFQDNPSVAEADAASIGLRLGIAMWPSVATSLEVEIDFERADADVAGDLTFSVYGAAAKLTIPTAGKQSLVLESRGQLPGPAGAPAQRWRALGGWGSLPTLRPTERVGDMMWWGAATYRIPLRPEASLLTRLDVWAQYAAGNAWIDGQSRLPTVHDLGLGLSLGPLAAAVYSDVANDWKTVFAMGIDTAR